MNTKTQKAQHQDSYVMVPIEKQNLALVSASPDLFEALKAMLQAHTVIDHQHLIGIANSLALKAIAKARGE